MILLLNWTLNCWTTYSSSTISDYRSLINRINDKESSLITRESKSITRIIKTHIQHYSSLNLSIYRASLFAQFILISFIESFNMFRSETDRFEEFNNRFFEDSVTFIIEEDYQSNQSTQSSQSSQFKKSIMNVMKCLKKIEAMKAMQKCVKKLKIILKVQQRTSTKDIIQLRKSTSFFFFEWTRTHKLSDSSHFSDDKELI